MRLSSSFDSSLDSDPHPKNREHSPVILRFRCCSAMLLLSTNIVENPTGICKLCRQGFQPLETKFFAQANELAHQSLQLVVGWHSTAGRKLPPDYKLMACLSVSRSKDCSFCAKAIKSQSDWLGPTGMVRQQTMHTWKQRASESSCRSCREEWRSRRLCSGHAQVTQPCLFW